MLWLAKADFIYSAFYVFQLYKCAAFFFVRFLFSQHRFFPIALRQLNFTRGGFSGTCPQIRALFLSGCRYYK